MPAEVFLTIANKVISRESITGAISLVEFFRKSPKWLNDSYTISAKITLDEREKSKIFFEFIKAKMLEHEYSDSEIDKFSVIYHEIVANAFDHGCSSESDEVIISIQIASIITVMITLNPKGRNWDFEASLDNAALRVRSGNHRGRGLLLVKHLSGSVQSCHENQGIKVIFTKGSRKFAHEDRDNILEISIFSKGNSNNFHLELNNIIKQSKCMDAIISIVGYLNSSELGSIITTYATHFEGRSKTLALCASTDVLEFCEICGIDEKIRLFATIEEARKYIRTQAL